MSESLPQQESAQTPNPVEVLKSELIGVKTSLTETQTQLAHVTEKLEEALELNKQEKLGPGGLEQITSLREDIKELSGIVENLNALKKNLLNLLGTFPTQSN